jgi:hypothetical protein
VAPRPKKSAALFRVTGWTRDGVEVDQEVATHEQAKKLARTMSVVTIAYLRPLLIDETVFQPSAGRLKSTA